MWLNFPYCIYKKKRIIYHIKSDDTNMYRKFCIKTQSSFVFEYEGVGEDVRVVGGNEKGLNKWIQGNVLEICVYCCF